MTIEMDNGLLYNKEYRKRNRFCVCVPSAVKEYIIKDRVHYQCRRCGLTYKPPELIGENMNKEFTSVKDSGAEEQFATGAVRDVQTGKGRFDLIPAYPLERLAKHYENGAKRYSDNNWCKGMPVSRCLDSLLRHANHYKAGKTDEDHLSAIVFNAFAIIYYEEMVRQNKLPADLLLHKDICNDNNKKE